jgi:hypothetical protein
MPPLIITTASGDTHAVAVEPSSVVSVQGEAGNIVLSDVVRVETIDVVQAAEPVAPAEPNTPPDETVPAEVTELTLQDAIDAITSHAEANDVAKLLGVEGFEEKKPNLDAKREALKAAVAALPPEQPKTDEA